MDINYSSLMAQLAAQKKGSEALWSQNDWRQQLSRALQNWERTSQMNLPSYSRVAANSQAPESVEDQVAQEMEAADHRGPNSIENRAERDAYSEAKLREQQGYGLAETADPYSDARLRDQLGMAPKGVQPKAPMENYLAGVTDQSEYRNAMMQYLSAGGQKPKWYTGDFDTDKPNIETAVKSTMTPLQQLQRSAQVESLQSLQETRQAQLDLRKQAQADKVREQVAKREAIKPKTSEIIPTKNERTMALDALEGTLGAEVFDQLPPEQAADVARIVAAKAKAKMSTPEGKGVDYESLVQDELQDLIAKGQLKKGKEGGWFGIGAEKPSFSRTEKPSAGQVPRPGEVYKGYKYKGGDPSKPTSWEKS